MCPEPDIGVVLILPRCPACELHEGVRSLAVNPVFYGVRYYVCDGCGHSWAKELPPPAIDT